MQANQLIGPPISARRPGNRARELRSLDHDVRLIPPQYVRPFVKTNKNDAADAEGICEAVVRPNMRFVPIKSIEQQAAMMLHRTRALLLRQRTLAATEKTEFNDPDWTVGELLYELPHEDACHAWPPRWHCTCSPTISPAL